MKYAWRATLVALALLALVPVVGAQDLAAGTAVLAQTRNDVKFFPATVVKKALDGYTVRFEDGHVEDVLQADMAFADPPEAAKLAEEVKVAAYAYGDCYPGRIYEKQDDENFVVAWDSSGADPVALADIRLRMAPRSDPRPKPPAPSPAPPSAPPPAAAPPPEDDFGAALSGILGSAGDHYPMKYSLVAPAKSAELKVKTDLAEITLDIPADYVPVGLDFKIRNRTSKTFTIDWSKCYVTSFAGAKRAVFHNNYSTLEAMPAVEKPSEVAAGAEQVFSLLPREGIVSVFRPAHWDGPNWIEKYTEILNIALFFGPDLPNELSYGYTDADKAKDLELRKKNVVGKSFKVGIAIVAEGKTTITEMTVRIDALDAAHEASMFDGFGK